MNREVAFALEKLNPGKVGLFATEGPGDYQPDMKQVRRIPGLESLCVRGRKNSRADVVIRNLYPPRVADMDGLINLLYFAWEESALPSDWVQSFNRHLDGLTVLSQFVKKVLLDAGVHVPIVVAGCGIPPENPRSGIANSNANDRLAFRISDFLRGKNRLKYRGYLGKSFRFLHISSGFPRKGVDVLLQAYTREFTSRDPVTLVIKTFPNPHNQTGELVRSYRDRIADCPEIVLINKDLPNGVLQELYRKCHAFVAPSRGEGFGLPMAEAMAAGIPVITTAAGGQVDFCTEETSWLIDYRWEPARTHMGLSNSVWAEPDADQLARVMREVFQVLGEKANSCAHKSEIRNAKYEQYLKKIDKAKHLVQSYFTWTQCAGRVMEAVQRIEQEKPLSRKKIKLGWVTPWNTSSPISASSKLWIDHLSPHNCQLKILASTTHHLLGADGENVIRCWRAKDNADLVELEKTIAREAFDVVVIQFHFSLFHLPSLGALIDSLYSQGIPTVISLNAIEDMGETGVASLAAIRRQLALSQRLLVPRIGDLNILKELGLVDNATLFPGGLDSESWKVAGWRLNGMIRALAREARSQKTPEIENIHPLTFGMNELQQAG